MSKKLVIENIRKFAESKGGKLLSNKYVNTETKLTWQCSNGHIWEASAHNVINGKTWCVICAGREKIDIYFFKNYAIERGGKCLSSFIKNINEKLEFECSEGHRWRTAGATIRHGHSWCPRCARKAKHTIREMQELAAIKGGACLSQIYVNTHTPLLWKCKNGHEWSAWPSRVIRGSWCPTCPMGINERACRAIFETLFNKKFVKGRVRWLISSKGKLMELDGYCKELKLAFEYQGIQHFERVQHFGSVERFTQRRKDDEIKRRLCKKNGVTLIEIPYFVEIADIPNYVKNECSKFGIYVPNPDINIDILNFYSEDLLKEINDIAREKGGLCLSTKYALSINKLSFKCKEGHLFKMSPHAIKASGSWCPVCAGVKKYTIENIQTYAKEMGGSVLSDKYVNTQGKLKFICKYGHEWETTRNSLRSGAWCPYCVGRAKKTIDEIRKYAIGKGGVCLSQKYLNTSSKLKWQCKEGHIWEATPNHITHGHWCPYCAHRVKLTIEEMRQIAKDKGGKCLSNEYINSNTKLKWQCKEGHIWEARPADVKQAHWCPRCAKERMGMYVNN